LTRCLHIRASLPHGHGHRAPHLVTPPEPYPLATQAKIEPSSIRSTANFVKAVDSVPRGVLQRASLVGRAVLAAPQPGLAPLGNPGERPSRLAASGSHMVPPSACAHPILCTHPVHPPCAPCAPCAPRLFDPLKSVLFPLLIVAVALRINQCGDGARAVLSAPSWLPAAPHSPSHPAARGGGPPARACSPLSYACHDMIAHVPLTAPARGVPGPAASLAKVYYPLVSLAQPRLTNASPTCTVQARRAPQRPRRGPPREASARSSCAICRGCCSSRVVYLYGTDRVELVWSVCCAVCVLLLVFLLSARLPDPPNKNASVRGGRRAAVNSG